MFDFNSYILHVYSLEDVYDPIISVKLIIVSSIWTVSFFICSQVFLKAMAETGQIKLYGDHPTLTETSLYRARRHIFKEERYCLLSQRQISYNQSWYKIVLIFSIFCMDKGLNKYLSRNIWHRIPWKLRGSTRIGKIYQNYFMLLGGLAINVICIIYLGE